MSSSMFTFYATINNTFTLYETKNITFTLHATIRDIFTFNATSRTLALSLSMRYVSRMRPVESSPAGEKLQETELVAVCLVVDVVRPVLLLAQPTLVW